MSPIIPQYNLVHHHLYTYSSSVTSLNSSDPPLYYAHCLLQNLNCDSRNLPSTNLTLRTVITLTSLVLIFCTSLQPPTSSSLSPTSGPAHFLFVPPQWFDLVSIRRSFHGQQTVVVMGCTVSIWPLCASKCIGVWCYWFIDLIELLMEWKVPGALN